MGRQAGTAAGHAVCGWSDVRRRQGQARRHRARSQQDHRANSTEKSEALTIEIGGTTVTYDGSAAKTVTIADGTEVSY